MKFLKALDTWGTFGKGWTRRVKDVETEALRMASNGPTEQPASAPKPVPAPQAHAKPSPAPVPPPAVQPGIVALVLAAGAAFLAWAGDVPCNLIGVLCQ